MVARILKWVAVLAVPKLLKTADKPANAMLNEYQQAARKALSECGKTSKEVACESVAASTEMAKLEIWKAIVRNHESIRSALLAIVAALLSAGILLGGVVVCIFGLSYGISELFQDTANRSNRWLVLTLCGGLLTGLPIALGWLLILRRGAWDERLLRQVRKIRYAEKAE